MGSEPTGIVRPQRAARSPRLLMVLGVVFCGLVPVMGRMQPMRIPDVRVMARLFVIARFVVLRRSARFAALRDDAWRDDHGSRLGSRGGCRPCGSLLSC